MEMAREKNSRKLPINENTAYKDKTDTEEILKQTVQLEKK